MIVHWNYRIGIGKPSSFFGQSQWQTGRFPRCKSRDLNPAKLIAGSAPLIHQQPSGIDMWTKHNRTLMSMTPSCRYPGNSGRGNPAPSHRHIWWLKHLSQDSSFVKSIRHPSLTWMENKTFRILFSSWHWFPSQIEITYSILNVEDLGATENFRGPLPCLLIHRKNAQKHICRNRQLLKILGGKKPHLP